MGNAKHYVIRGGVQGRERLRVVARVLHASSAALLDRLELRNGLSCLDVGCGGGDVTLELARRVSPGGRVVGIDIDEEKLQIARMEAQQQGVGNVEFRVSDIREAAGAPEFDVVYSRFLLTHLSNPAAAVSAFYHHLRPGGRVAIEDIDFSGHFTCPESPAFRRYHALYCASVARRGGDPNIGPRVPGLLRQCGFEDIGVAVVQRVAMQGEAKLTSPLTMENIADTLLAEGLAGQEEIDELVRELYEFAADPETLAGTPRIVQAWGRKTSLFSSNPQPSVRTLPPAQE